MVWDREILKKSLLIFNSSKILKNKTFSLGWLKENTETTSSLKLDSPPQRERRNLKSSTSVMKKMEYSEYFPQFVSHLTGI